MHFLAWAVCAVLTVWIFRNPPGIGAGGFLFAFATWRYILNRRLSNFLEEAPITLGESPVTRFRWERNVYRLVMSYAFEGRTYSSQGKVDQADHAAVLNREMSLYAIFDRRNPGKMLSYRTGVVIPRWLKSRSEKSVTCEAGDALSLT